jgi:hypothetical protein
MPYVKVRHTRRRKRSTFRRGRAGRYIPGGYIRPLSTPVALAEIAAQMIHRIRAS